MSGAVDRYDGIVIGAGHNGLILQAYAAQAGLSVLAIDRAPEAGGGLTTVEDPRHPGFRHNTHAFFHRALTQMPWVPGSGAGAPRCALPGARTQRRVAAERRPIAAMVDRFRAYPRLVRPDERARRGDPENGGTTTSGPIVDEILIPESLSPPLPADRRRTVLEGTPEGRLLLEVSALSPLEFVTREFVHPTIQAGLLFFNGLREVDLRVRGFGHHIAALLASTAKAQMTLGGARFLARALQGAAEEAGATILTGAEPRRILVENGRAVGVETGDGRQILARRFVASSLNPHQTFIDLLEPGHLPERWREAAENFRYNLIAPLFALNLNLTAPPSYAAARNDPALEKPFMVIMGLEHMRQYPEIVRHHEAGTVPPTVMWGACPTQFDPSQAPPGKHTAFMWEKLPYRLQGDAGSWDRAKDEHGKAMLRLWAEYAPGLEERVIDRFTRSPLDVERSFPNMRYGDLLVGAFYRRPGRP